MRIRIIEPRVASVDGVDLSVFHGGQVYEVEPTIATYLIVSGVAEPGPEDSPALVIRSDEVMVAVFASAGRVISDVADDWEDDA
jgi:hypothetical protein